MIDSELLPIISGMLLGSLLGSLRQGLRLRVGAAAAVVLGAVATAVSGEILVSGWYRYLFFDVSMVAACAAVSLKILHRLHWVRG